MKPQDRIVSVEGYEFINVSDIALTLWDNPTIELFELDDDGVEHLIEGAHHLERAYQTGLIVIERDVAESLGLLKYPFNEGDDYWTLEPMNPVEYILLSNNGENPSALEVVMSCWDEVSEEMHDLDPLKKYFSSEEEAQDYLDNL